MVRIGMTGDVMLGRLVDRRQRRRPVDAVWGDLADRLRACDGLFVNLECCLSTRGEPWQRTYRPFHFRADPDLAILALERVGVDACALANNHLLDFGAVALYDTLDALDRAGIAHAGAGSNRDEALEPALIPIGDVRVGLFSLTDNTPEYAATADSAGTAHIDVDLDAADTRATAREVLTRLGAVDPDLVIGSLHWGPNMEARKPDAFRDFARWLVDEGVDVIHGHSAHVFQGIEVYEGRPIMYDTGDFIDDYAVDDRLRNDRSFLFELTVDAEGRPAELRLLPTEIAECAVRKAGPEVATWSRERMRSLSEEVGTRFQRDGEALVLSLGA